VPSVDERLNAVGAARRNRSAARAVLRRLHSLGIQHALLAAADQAVAGKKKGAARSQIGVAIVERCPVANRVIPDKAEPVGGRRPDAELDKTLAEIGIALYRSVAGLEIDVALAVADDAFARRPDAAAPTGCAGSSKNAHLLQVGGSFDAERRPERSRPKATYLSSIRELLSRAKLR
jgi:hypothetical protein